MDNYAQRYRQTGYVVGRGILNADRVSNVERFLWNELDKAAGVFHRYGLDIEDRDLGAKLEILKPGVLGRELKDELDVFSGTFPLDTRLSPNLWDLCADPSLRVLLQSILRSDNIFMHMAPTARFVPPGYSHAAVPPHRDVTYNDHMTGFVTVWTPFVEIDELCGGVRIFLESGAADPEISEKPEKDEAGFWYKPEKYDDYQYVDIDMSPGDVLIFSSRTLHTSRPNLSNRQRLSLDMRFFGAQDRTGKHYLDLQRMEVFEPFTGDQHVRV